jgi:HEAT repeat protein
MRFQAAWTSGELMLREAVPILAQLIHDPDRQICNATIWALGQIGGSQAKQILISFYRAADEDIRIAIDEALAELALAEGDLEFPLYNFDKLDKHDWPDDESFPLWIEEEEEDWDL